MRQTEKEQVEIPHLVTNNNLPAKASTPGSNEDFMVPYEPWKERNIAHPLGTFGALFHLLKGSLGSGILSVPVAFKSGGLWASLVGTIFVACVYAHCVHILVYSSQELTRRVRTPHLGFANIAETAFLTGPTRWRRYTNIAKGCVDAELFLGYYCCCVVYVVFTASSVQQIVEDHFAIHLDVRVYTGLLTVLVLPLGMVNNLKYLVPFSLFAVIMLMVGCCFVLYSVFQDLPPLSSRPAFTSLERIPVFISTMLYATDGIGTVFPVENSMKKPQHFLGCPGVFSVAVIWLTVLYCVMGFFGYLRYGEDTMGTITLNIPSSALGEAVKLMVTLNVLCSYGLFFYVPSEIIWKNLETRISPENKTCYFYILRLVLVLLSVVLAAIVPNLESFVGLVGAVSASTLTLFFPPVIELVTFWEEPGYMGRCRWRLWKNLLIIFLWVVIFITGTTKSIIDIVALY